MSDDGHGVTYAECAAHPEGVPGDTGHAEARADAGNGVCYARYPDNFGAAYG